MFCTNCGEELKEGLKFCTNCGAKVEDDASFAPEMPMAAIESEVEPQTEPMAPTPPAIEAKTATMTPMAPAVASRAVEHPAVPSQQQTPSQIREAKSSKAPTVVLVIATIVIVVGGALASLAIVQPPIEFLKDTPFSSVKTQTKTETTNKTEETKETEESQNTEKKEVFSNSKSDNSNSSSTKSETYIIKDSDTRKLSSSDIANLTDDQICIANNEIWARRGRKFANNWLQDYFNKQSWYNGTIEAGDFLSVYSPSQIENDNASFLMNALNERGYDVNKAHPN